MRTAFAVLAALSLPQPPSSGAAAQTPDHQTPDHQAPDHQAADLQAADGARLLVLIDGDMAATAYANGVLHPVAGASDRLVPLALPLEPSPASDPAPGAGAPVGIAVSNTVMGWPGSMTVSADGARAYVVTSKGTPPAGTERYDSVYTGMPDARTLTTVDLRAGAATESEACDRPMAVDIAPSGGWLLAACADGPELAVVPLTDGRPGAPRLLDLDAPDPGEGEPRASFAAIHPGGAAAGVVLGNTRVALVRFALGPDGVPVSAEMEAPTRTDRWLSVARWTPSGRHLIVADVGWGPKPTDAVFNGRGALVSFAMSPDDAVRGEASVARVSKSPEGFALSPDGALAVAVNMERTYLPGGWMRVFRGRNASSVSLVAVGADGTLETIGEPTPFRGVLPEDAAFLPDGRVAVAVYQDHDAPRSGGWVAVFAIESEGASRRLVETGTRVDLPRGAHDLIVAGR